VLALWARRGFLEGHYDVLEVWRGWAEDVRGRSIDSGHYIPEEAPEETLSEVRAFFGEGGPE
jgi:haloacetate dehalogenase